MFIHFLAFLSLAKIDGGNIDLYDQSRIYLISMPRRGCTITVSGSMSGCWAVYQPGPARARGRDKSVPVCAKPAVRA